MIHNLILGASIIFPIACGVMGFLVTTRTPPPKYKKLIEVSFVALAFLGAGSAAWLAHENDKTQGGLQNGIGDLKGQLGSVRDQLSKLINMQVASSPHPLPVIPHPQKLAPQEAAAPKVNPQKTIQPMPSPSPPVAGISFVQRDIVSTDPNEPYETQVIIQTTQTIDGPVFGIDTGGPIDSGEFFLAGQGAVMNIVAGVTGDHLGFKLGFGYPAFTPDAPIVVTLHAKAPFQILRVIDLRGHR